MFQTFAPAEVNLKKKARGVRCFLAFLLLSLGFLGGLAQAQEAVESRELGDLVAPAAEEATPDQTAGQTTASGTGAEIDLTGEGDQSLPQTIEQLGNDAAPDSDNTIELIDKAQPLRIGLVAERGAAYLQGRIAPFRSYLQQALSRPVEIIAFNDMSALIAAHTSKQVDYASYPAGVFAMAQAACGCLLPLVAPVSQQEPEGIYILMVVRSDSPIKSLADMTGRSLALSSRRGALPYHMALNELQRSGLDPNRDLSTVFSRDTPEEALALLENGEADAALVWSSTRYSQQLSTSDGAVSAYLASKSSGVGVQASSGFLSIWSSPAIPAGPHAVHTDMPKQQRADLVRALTAMNKDDPAAYDAIERYYDGGFRRVSLEDYEPIVQVATSQ
ncbi:PhnD/SsuA/transferrin family substrate-binding protein [uncultured Cohaesibacter sp.]|uniref:phosphate/phosphite/phosphonate ABC transporter substrate-binding protein n=1 Tax=uncultured Cohaesibacter sp. TaxID=1002546 RepID=UPI0029C63BD2|nr:PhnD/SsuA/transferrin family substrate-binding protein [uncultured Cohaesibacter sp.]